MKTTMHSSFLFPIYIHSSLIFHNHTIFYPFTSIISHSILSPHFIWTKSSFYSSTFSYIQAWENDLLLTIQEPTIGIESMGYSTRTYNIRTCHRIHSSIRVSYHTIGKGMHFGVWIAWWFIHYNKIPFWGWFWLAMVLLIPPSPKCF